MRDDGIPTPPFAGFADANARFFRALAKNQNREWFLAHKAEYERGWLEPMKALLAEVRDQLARSYPCEIGDVNVFRIFRDVRFSNDKSPYKTQVAGYVGLARDGSRLPGPVPLYVHLGTDTYVGAGHWIMEPAQLERYRAALLDERRGAAIAKLLAKLEQDGFSPGAHDTLKKVPRGLDPAHPRATLLKQKGLVVAYPRFDRTLITSHDFVDWLVKHSKRAAPVVEWLAETIVEVSASTRRVVRPRARA